MRALSATTMACRLLEIADKAMKYLDNMCLKTDLCVDLSEILESLINMYMRRNWSWRRRQQFYVL